MDEEEAWKLFSGKVMDEDKVAPWKRAAAPVPAEQITDERAQSLLSHRIGQARKKHPEYAKGAFDAYQVIVDEVLELRHAVGHESRERQVDEALDVAATAMRFVMGEHLGK